MALHEPLTPSDFDVTKGRAAAVMQIANFAAAMRTSALTRGVVLSRVKNGRVPENPVAPSQGAGLRPLDVNLGEMDVSAQVEDERFTLVIKHNALFTGLLPELAQQFPVYGVVRNPLAVLASWNQVDLPVNRGHIPAAEMFCPELQSALALLPDRIERQLYILEWFFLRFAEHLGDRLVRYEQFVQQPELLARALAIADSHQKDVAPRTSRNHQYDLALMEYLYRRLKNYGAAIWQYYSLSELDELMENLRAAE